MRVHGLPSGEAIDVCEGCGGLFIEFFDGGPREIARALTRASIPDGVPAMTATCCDCDAAMVLHRYLEVGPEVLRCGGCMAMFVMLDELAALAAHSEFEKPKPSGFLEEVVAAFDDEIFGDR